MSCDNMSCGLKKKVGLMMDANHLPVYDGDSLLLYCTESSGYLYCEPRSFLSPNFSVLTVHKALNENKLNFPNIEFAAFNVTQSQRSPSSQMNLTYSSKSDSIDGDSIISSDPLSIVYGSTVKLQHKASGKYLSITPSTPGYLDGATSDNCIFQLVSPKQDKGWGDDLIHSDHVKFESVNHRGYKIRCVYNAKGASYQLVLSVTGSAFSIKSHCHKETSLNPNSIKGGSLIMLTSLKMDGYVSAQGSFANEQLLKRFRQAKQKVGLHRWHKGYFKVLPFSGATYFQFEKVVNISSGSPFVYGEECRIKHIPTQQYITFFSTSDGFKISLKPLQVACGHEVFKILPVNDNARTPSTTEQTQLLEFDKIMLQHVNSQKLLSINVKPALKKESIVQHDPLNQWFNLILDSEEHKSVFQVIKVEDCATVDIYDVIGITSSLCSLLKKLSYFSNKDQEMHDTFVEINIHMKSLQLFFHNRQNNGERLANMIRVFQGVDALVSILIKSTMQSDRIEGKRQVCNSICSALEQYITIGSKRSHKYMTKREILDSLFSLVGKGYGTERVLITLCKDDIDIRDQMQDSISSLIKPLNIDDHYVAELMTTLAFNGRKFNREIQNQIYVKTLESEIDGHHINADVKSVLGEFVTRSGQCLELVGIATGKQPYTYNYDNLSVYLNQHNSLNQQYLQEMEQEIRHFLSSDEIHILSYEEAHKSKNSIIAHILGVLVFLVDYGFYHNRETEANEMIRILIKILDGSNDKCKTGYNYNERYKMGRFSGSKIIFKIKTMVLQCLQLFLTRHCYTSLEKLLYDYKVLKSEMAQIRMRSSDKRSIEYLPAMEMLQVAIHTSHSTDVICSLLDPPSPEMRLLINTGVPISQEMTRISRDRLRCNFHNSNYEMFDICMTDSQELCDILMDSINYEDPDICLMSAELLYDMYNVETTLLSSAEKVYLYSNEDDQTLSAMLDISNMTDDDQLLKKMLEHQVDDVPKLLSKLKEFADMCLPENEEPNPYYQGVAYSCGLFNMVLEYVLECGNSNHIEQTEIMSSCCKLLQCIASRNPIAQEKLFNHFQDLMNIKIAVTPAMYLFNEIFVENSSLCDRLTESDIKHFFYFATASCNPEHYELLVTLKTIIRTIKSSTPMQEYIIQLFLEMWEDNLGHIYGLNNKSARIDILMSDDHEPNLILLLNTGDLLARCTEGECQYADSVVSEFFPITDLLEIMTNDKITIIHHKLPFTKILTWTYLNTDRDSLATCSELASSDLFWSHLEDELRVIDDKVINPIKLLSAKQYSLLRRKLRDLYRFNWSIMKWMNFASDLDNGDNFIGNLLYIIKGLIPLLSAFCHETSLHFSGANDICKGFNIPSSLIQQLGDKLAMFHDVLRSTGYHTDLRYCLENVTSLCNALNEAEDDNPDDLNSLESTSETAVREVVTIVHENVSSSIKPIVSMQRHINLTPVHNNDAVRDIVNRNAGFQEYIKRYQQAYSFDHDNEAYDSSDIHENYFTIPKGPSFKKLITLFMDSDEDFKNSKDLKIRKLVIILNTLIHKQNRQEIRSSERAGLERITLLTLQLICGVVFERISRVPREWLPPKEFEQQYDAIIHPIQEMLLGERIVEMLFSMLQYPKDDIAFQVLACLNVLLYPGNEEAQTKISLLVNHHINHELFYRVHQILTGAQSYINREKMGKALAQIAAMSPDGVGELDTPLSERLLRRNKKLLYNQKSTTPPVRSSKKFTKKQKILGTNEFEKAKVAVDNRIIMALNVLSWLCDGQQKELQDMLREQKVLTATNIVSQVTFLLYGIAENLNEGNVNVSQSAVQALIEMCAGNYNNQLIAFKGQVIRSINIILKLKTFSYAIEQFRKLKSSSIELLEIMLEETDEKSSQLAQWIISHLDMTFLLNAMFELFDSQSSSDKWKSSIFRSYHVLRRIADFKNITVDDLVDYKKYTNDCKFAELFKENTDDAKRMWQYCHMWSRSVEIVYKAQSGTELLTRVYFPYDPHKHLNEMEKNTILLHIKRNTPQEKLFDLLQWTQALRKAHAWKKKIKNSWISYMFLWASTVRHFILIFLTLLLNALVLFGLNGPEERVSNISNSSSAPLEYFRPNFMPPSPPWFHPLLYLFGAIHLILAIWMVLQYFVKHWCNISFSMPLVNSIVYDIKKGLLRKKHLYRFMKYMNRVFCSNRIRALRPQTQEHFQTYFFSFEPIYRLVFVLCSLLSLIFSGYFYCGCTLYAFLRNQVLHNILKAVGRSALQLFTVLMLGLVITYMYAVFSFAIMSNDFNTNQDLFCRNIFECFITITRLGFLDTLGLGIPIRPDNDIYPPNFDVLVFRMFYDIFFFIVVTILGLNVVVAILVDRFSEIRDEKERIDADNLNQCFICSIKKDVFERNGKNFQKHYHKDHYMWNYVNFILYLDTIHPNDRNALEKYIAQQVPSKENTAGSIDFFPLFKAKILSGVDILAENYDI